MTSLGIPALAPQPIHAGMVSAGSATFSVHDPNDPNVTQPHDDTAQVVSQILQIESGSALLLDQVKRNLISTKDIITFLKKRAVMEEEYAKSIQRLCSSLTESIDKKDGKSGCYENSIRDMVKIHTSVASQHLILSQNISLVADELNTVYKDTDRSRRQLKDASERNDKQLYNAELQLEKALVKYDQTNDALNKIQTPSSSLQSSSLLSILKNKPTDIDVAHARVQRANSTYQHQLQTTIKTRAQYVSMHLPSLVRSLKEVNDECNVALQYHLSKYAFHYEHLVTQNAFTLCPKLVHDSTNVVATSSGIRSLFESMDHAKDLQLVITSASPSNALPATPNTYFGMALMDLAKRDNCDIPILVRALIHLITQFVPGSVGVYLKPGNHALIHKLQVVCDKDPSMSKYDHLSQDVHTLTGLLKLYLRSLPDSVIPKTTSIDLAALFTSRMDSRAQLIKVHELINQLPDPHYATLRHIVLHLSKVQVSSDKLAQVFAPILMHSACSSINEVTSCDGHVQALMLILSQCQVLFESEE